MSNNNAREIITDVNLLRKKNDKVNPEEIEDLIKTLEASLGQKGIGLAAPQIGINKQIAIVRTDESFDLVNPQIIKRWGAYLNKEEGCLSFPNKKFNTFRFKQIHIIDDLHPSGLILTDLMATACEHEINHLQGILIIDRATDQVKLGRNDLCPCGSLVKFKKCCGR